MSTCLLLKPIHTFWPSDFICIFVFYTISIGMISSTPLQHVHSLGHLYLKNATRFSTSQMEGSKVTLLMRFVSQRISIQWTIVSYRCVARRVRMIFGMSSAGVSCSRFLPIDWINNRRQPVNDNSPPVFTSVPALLFSSLKVTDLELERLCVTGWLKLIPDSRENGYANTAFSVALSGKGNGQTSIPCGGRMSS